MQPGFRMAHLVVGAATVIAFLITGVLMFHHDPALATMDWAERLLFRSRHIYLLCAGLANIAMGVNYLLPERAPRRSAAVAGSLLALSSSLLLFFAFFAEPMAGRPAGALSAYGLYALFGGVLLYALVSLRRVPAGAA